MPIYEYQCQSCGHQLEIIHKISADPATDCPECNESALKKKVSAAAFRLKGGGWYETDFKSGDKKKNLVSDKGDSSASASSSSASTTSASSSSSSTSTKSSD